MLDPYQELANAIVAQAASDYRSALKRLKSLALLPPPDDEKEAKSLEGKRMRAAHKAAECESFFRSKWFGILSAADGEYIVRKIREEVSVI